MIWPPAEKLQSDFKLLTPGDWFVPVTVKEVDQYKYLEQSVNKGIAGFVCEPEESQKYKSLSVPHIVVPNLREFLFQEARNKRDFLNLDIVTISGSNGKTTVKELVGKILKDTFEDQSFMSPANQNTKIALATQISRLNTQTKAAVFEVGARRKGDFKIPFSFLKPKISALLNMGTAHIGEFGSLEILQEEKLSALKNPWAQTLVVPSDDPVILQTAKSTRKNLITFGYEPHSDIQIVSSHSNEVTLKHLSKDYQIFCPTTLVAFELNLAAAAAIALSLSISWQQIIDSLKTFDGVQRRFFKFNWNSHLAIDDAFNASPESMHLGLKTLKKQFPDARPLLVLGSMLELGDRSENEHRKLAKAILDLFPSKNFSVVGVGDEIKPLIEEFRSVDSQMDFRHFRNSLDAKSYVTQAKDDFDVTYFKGSKSVQLQKIWEDS